MAAALEADRELDAGGGARVKGREGGRGADPVGVPGEPGSLDAEVAVGAGALVVDLDQDTEGLAHRHPARGGGLGPEAPRRVGPGEQHGGEAEGEGAEQEQVGVGATDVDAEDRDPAGGAEEHLALAREPGPAPAAPPRRRARRTARRERGHQAPALPREGARDQGRVKRARRSRRSPGPRRRRGRRGRSAPGAPASRGPASPRCERRRRRWGGRGRWRRRGR